MFSLLKLANLTLRDLGGWSEVMVEALQAGGCPKESRRGWKGEASGMRDMAHQLGFCLPQSPLGRRRAHSKPSKKPMVSPIEGQKLEDPQVSGERGTEVTGRGGRRVGKILLPGWRSEFPVITPGYVGGPRLLGCQSHATSVTMTPSLPKPPSSEPKLALQPEPTFEFLFTLLSVEEAPEPKDPEE